MEVENWTVNHPVYREKLRTKCTGVEQNVGNLSGGNQQKVLLAAVVFDVISKRNESR